jgi:hypothetical protein
MRRASAANLEQTTVTGPAPSGDLQRSTPTDRRRDVIAPMMRGRVHPAGTDLLGLLRRTP